MDAAAVPAPAPAGLCADKADACAAAGVSCAPAAGVAEADAVLASDARCPDKVASVPPVVEATVAAAVAASAAAAAALLAATTAPTMPSRGAAAAAS